MANKCETCEKWIEKKKELLMKSESIFDMAADLEDFEKECAKNCQLNFSES